MVVNESKCITAYRFVKRNLQKSLRLRGFSEIPVIPLPLPISEEELQSHDDQRAFFLLKVNHAGKSVETTLERPYIYALIGRPVLFGQDARAMKAHVPRGGDLVVGEVQADQRYGHFERRSIFCAARRTRVHGPPIAAEFTATVGTGWKR